MTYRITRGFAGHLGGEPQDFELQSPSPGKWDLVRFHVVPYQGWRQVSRGGGGHEIRVADYVAVWRKVP